MELRNSIVGIVAKSSAAHRFAGTGFFVEGGYLLTCAHVVDAARRTDGRLQFRIEGGGKYYEAEVAARDAAQDICVLRPIHLDRDIPALRLVASRQSDGHPFKAFGYPQQGNFDGLHADGRIMGWVRDHSHRDALQLSSNKLTHGFSGCPVWDESLGGVVGMVSGGFDFGLDKKLGNAVFAIPSEVLANVDPKFPLHEAIQPVPPKGWFFGHRYGDLDTFTGRAAELDMLNAWLNNDKNTLLMLRALGGFGKSALAWTWFNRVDRTKWPTAIWWSFYEKESGFESFLSETLKHLGVEVKQSARQQVNDLLEAMRGTNILIVLDGFERLLRQYGRMDAALQSDDEDAGIDPSQRDCSSLLTETFLRGLSGAGTKSKVLMTTRLCPRALESADGKLLKGCREEPLTAFSPEDAVTYFHNEGIKATRAEVIEICAAYGYHPLSLSLLVGLINEDHEHRGDIAAVKNLEIFADVKARRHHVLERAYGSLAPERRDLLSKISCFRGSMEYAVLKKVFPSPDLDKALLDLRKRGLLQYAGETGRYDMHPIVRHYAYDHFTDAKRRKEAHVELAKYFGNTMPDEDAKVKTLEDLAPVIELYHHMVGAGNLDEACDLFYDRIWQTLYYQLGGYQLQIELLRALFLDGEDKPPHLKEEGDQAFIFNELASAYSMSGQPRRSVPLLEMANDIDINEKRGEKQGVAIGLGNVATQQLVIGALSAAKRNLRHSIDLCREIADEFHEAIGHQELGRVLSYRGAWQEAEQELTISTKYWEKTNDYDGLCIDGCYRSQFFLLLKNPQKALIESQQVLKAWEEDANQRQSPAIPTLIRTLWLLGAAYRSSAALRSAQNEPNNELTLAEENLSKALNLCRQINLVDAEADILLDLARLSFDYALREAQGSAQDELFRDAQEKASEALVITERCGYVLQGADVNLFLAELALTRPFGAPSPDFGRGESEHSEDGVRALARKYAEEAKRLAYCDGPPYYYKVAYEEAERFLARMEDKR